MDYSNSVEDSKLFSKIGIVCGRLNGIFKQRAAVYNEELVDGRFLERAIYPFSGTVFIRES
jgi:hypothetical protein